MVKSRAHIAGSKESGKAEEAGSLKPHPTELVAVKTHTTTTTTTRQRRTKTEVKYAESSASEDECEVKKASKTKSPRKPKRKAPVASAAEEEDETDDVKPPTVAAKKRKLTTTTTTTTTTAKTTTARAKKATTTSSTNMAPLAPRLLGAKMLVGAHVSMAGGVQNAITNAVNIGGNALALFVKNQRKWVSPPLKAPDIAAFRKACETHGYDPRTQILPHGSYLINLAQPEPEKAAKAYDCFVDDLKRCETLDIGLYNFHPGSTLGEPRAEALGRISAALNKAHKETKFVKTVVENMVGSGNVIGSDFEDLRDIIARVEDKKRMGICLDTCHLFGAGHDIRTKDSYEEVMRNFDKIVGREYLCALHLNDSKAPLASKKDLHENIGRGYLGLEPFRLLMNDERLQGLPMVLETPNDEDPSIWAKEIKLLESLVGMTGEEDDFKAMVGKLQNEGAAERGRVAAAVKRKNDRVANQKTFAKQKEAKKESGDEDEGGCSH